MKCLSSSTHFLDRLDSYSKKERCLNYGKLVPLVLTSLFIASIFSFFFLYYTPNSFTLTQQASDFVHTKQKPHNAQEEKQRCDLFEGHWVPSIKGSLYTNSSCPTIPVSKNCFKNGRNDSGFLNWRWKPQKCDLPSFDPKIFLHIVSGKKMAFIGDSVARNHMESLLCLLSQEETPENMYKDLEDRFRKWYFPKHDFTLIKLWTEFLIVGRERTINGSGSSIFDLHLDKVEEKWTNDLPDIDYAIISDGHWFFRVMYLHECNTQVVGCVYCRDQNMTNFDIDYPIRMAFRTALRHINSCKECKEGMVTLVRTFAPSHFENGAWNTGGYCNRTSPVGAGDIDLGSFDWKVRNAQVEELERAREEGKKHGDSKRFDMVDVTKATMMRPDGHPGAFWGNKWMKGYNDCTHWCMPGPIDVWNELLLEVLKTQTGFSKI